MLRLALAAAVVAALFPATATAADDGPIAFVVAEAGLDVAGPDGTGRRALLREPGAYSPAWSPDGRWVVYSGGELRAVSADGSRVVGLGVSGGAPDWSPDGTRIAFHSGGDVHVAHVTQDLQVLRVDRVTAGRSPTWSPDGARLAYVAAPYDELHVIEAGGGTPERLAPGQAAEDPDWSPDGRRIAFASGSDVWAVDVAGGGSERLLAGAAQPAWSPSGGRLAHSANGDVRVLDLASGALATPAGGPESESAPTWAGSAPPPAAPYGPGVEALQAGRIAFTRDREIYVMNPGGGDVRRLTRNDVADGEPAWAPPVPGRPTRLAFTRSGQIQVMRADGTGVRALTRSPGLHRSPAWSPDGRAIAFTRIPPGETAQVWIAEVDGGGERRVSPEGAAAYANPSWSPDGANLAFERVDTEHLIPPEKSALTYEYPRPDDPEKTLIRETRVIGLGFCTLSLVTGVLECRDSANQELAPIWGGAHEPELARLVYVANGAGAPDFPVLTRELWTTDLFSDTPYTLHRFAYDMRISTSLEDPADPAVAPDGSGLVVAARETYEHERTIAVVRTRGRRPGQLHAEWQVIDAGTYWLGEGTQPAWEARRAPLPALGDGSFERRSRVRGRLRGRTLTLVNRNRFWVTARVRRRTVRLRPATRRRATVRRVRVGGRVRRVRIADTAGHRRAIRVRSLSA